MINNNNHSSLLSLWNLKIMKDIETIIIQPAHVALRCDIRLVAYFLLYFLLFYLLYEEGKGTGEVRRSANS
jgi:hypothetical protein